LLLNQEGTLVVHNLVAIALSQPTAASLQLTMWCQTHFISLNQILITTCFGLYYLVH
jgi:hypothetical protein